MGGGEGVLGGARAAAGARLGERGGESLVVGLHGYVDQSRDLVGEAPGDLRLLALLAVQRDREADDDELGLVLGDELGDGLGSGGSITRSGRTSVPLGSEIAQPQRAVPWSMARMRIRARG